MKRKALLLLSLGLFFLVQAGGICWSQTTERVSVDTAGGNSDGGSNASSISSDGRYVAFQSEATDLVPAGSNGLIQIFVRDRQTGTTTQVSVNAGGQEGDFPSSAPSISGDGWHVAFESWATNLPAIGDGIFPDIFVRNRQTGDTIRVSVDSTGVEGGGPSFHPSISGDGRYVAFDSDADLVATDSGDYYDIFVHDRDADENGTYDEPAPVGISTVRVSVASGGGEANGHSYSPDISRDGRYVAFESFATDLVADDNGLFSDIFVYERESLPPTVNSTSPTHNANGVAIGSSITATFSKPMNGSTIDTNTFSLDNGVTGTVSYDANSATARFTPTSKLDYDTTYTVTITTGAEDLAGNPMLADYTWTFTTKSEKIIAAEVVPASSPPPRVTGTLSLSRLDWFASLPQNPLVPKYTTVRL